MASKKVISINESSLVDLKAELYRKETQLKRQKVDSAQPKKAPIWQKKKKELKRKDGKIETTTVTDSSYDKELEKSRQMLEAKSALYDKLASGEIEVPSDEDEQDGRFLVDFHQKTFPKNIDNEKQDNTDSSSQGNPAAVSPDEEWVEYVDAFGRSKMCLRKDLPEMKKKDEKVKMKSSEESKLTLLSDDMRRELIRKKWEEEVEEALDKPVGPVHYQDVLFDETRDHGVGYYKFSKVEEERQQQQNALNKLRTQTEQQRSKREKLLEKRKAAMDARLAKIRERKERKLREAGVVKNTQEQDDKTQEQDDKTQEQDDKTQDISNDNEESGSDEMFIGAMLERIRNKSTKMTHLNEWEKGKVDLENFDKPKRKTPSYDPRNERNPEFAPPSFYTSTNEKKKKPKWKEEERNNKMNKPVMNNQTSSLMQDSLNNDQLTSSNESLQSSSQWTVQNSVNPNYEPAYEHTNPNIESTNSNTVNTNHYVQSTSSNFQSTNPNVRAANPNLYNTFPNLPPPPIHTFPPPYLPPPPLLPPYQLPQYPPNIPHAPPFPPPLPNNHQYPNNAPQ